jgi:hypothetical protein
MIAGYASQWGNVSQKAIQGLRTVVRENNWDVEILD